MVVGVVMGMEVDVEVAVEVVAVFSALLGTLVELLIRNQLLAVTWNISDFTFSLYTCLLSNQFFLCQYSHKAQRKR